MKTLAPAALCMLTLCLCESATAIELVGSAVDPPLTGHVQFSHEAGFYREEFYLVLSSAEPDVDILYTLDGSDPLTENLGGKTYQYKNRYPLNPGDPYGLLLTKEIRSHLYTAPVLIYDRSPDADKLTEISSTFYANSYAPSAPVPKATVVKARLVKDGFTDGPVGTHTFFVGMDDLFTMPVLSLTMDDDLLFDYETGIYVAGKDFDDWRASNPQGRTDGFTPANYQRDVEYETHLELFDGSPFERVVDQNIGVKTSGNVSLYFPQKSLRLFARDDYGKSNIAHAIFPDLPDHQYKRLTLRNSGNDNRYTMFRDAAIHESVKHLNFGTQAYRPAVLFVNGEYWGIHNMREHLDKNYLKSRYDVDPDNLDLLELPEIPEGDRSDYDALFSFFETKDLSVQEHYDYVTTQMDIDNFTDYEIAEIFVANTDWPGKNVRLWRTRTTEIPGVSPSDGRWRWLMKDTDFGLGLGVPTKHNTLAFATAEDEQTLPNPWWSTMFLRKLLENKNYREKFINRFADLLNSCFHPDRMVSVIENLKSGIASEMPRHIARWNAPATMSTWHANVNAMQEFVKNRPGHQRQHIVDYFELGGSYQLTVDVSGKEKGYVRINTIAIKQSTAGIPENPYPWTGTYFHGIPVAVTAVPNPGYRFVRWTGSRTWDSNEMEFAFNADASLTAIFVAESDQVSRYSPHDRAPDVPTVPIFEWISADEGMYDLQVSTTPGFEHRLIDESNIRGSSFRSPLTLDVDKEYYWRMKLHNSSEWSEVWTFKTTEILPVGIEEIHYDFSVHPNPVAGEVRIFFSPSEHFRTLEIVDFTGRRTQDIELRASVTSMTVDVSQYPRGVYFIRLQNGRGASQTRKLLVK